MIFDENLHGIFHITTVDIHALECRWNARRRIHDGSLKLQIVESIFHHNNHNQNQNEWIEKKKSSKKFRMTQIFATNWIFHQIQQDFIVTVN